MVVNIIAHMVHSPPIHNDCFVNKDFIIIVIIIINARGHARKLIQKYRCGLDCRKFSISF